jgi:hypothetical protein
MFFGNRSRLTISIVAVAVAGVAIFALFRSNPGNHGASGIGAATPAANATNAPSPAAPSPTILGSMRPLDDALKQLMAAATGADSHRILARLRAYLLSLPKDVASRLIDQFLDGKRDALTKLPFSIQKNGFLSDAPSLRVFLLDMLAQINPQAAREYAMAILSTPGSPDEWAICLRNYALGGSTPQTQGYLESKFLEMLANSAWRGDPSEGYLEAFDVAVYTHDTALAPTFSQLIADSDNRAVAHAAYLALDRLVISDPAAVLSQLEAQPALMQGHEMTRADYFARADTADPRQKSLLESYLLDPSRTPQELQTFAGTYPNQNYMISNNLLTQTQTPTYANIVAQDRQALSTVQAWMADPRFQGLDPQLQAMSTRLKSILGGAGASR